MAESIKPREPSLWLHSTASLACQLGGISSSILFAAVVGSVGYTGIFLFGAIAATLALILVAICLSAKKLKVQQ